MHPQGTVEGGVGTKQVAGRSGSARRRVAKRKGRSRARRLARSSPLILLCVGLVCAGLYILSGGVEAADSGGSSSQASPAPVPGLPRAWETGIPVSTYSIANSRDANLITVIPIIGWSGKGPDVNIVLYHNSSAVGYESMTQASLGVDLGRGWSMSYSAHLVFPQGEPDKVIVVADDGARDTYEKVGSDWIAPTGVHDTLTQNGNTWTLTRKDQSKLEFEGESLTKVIDPCSSPGDELAITIAKGTGGTETVITDASGRQFKLEKIALPRGGWGIDKITDNSDLDDHTNGSCEYLSAINRSWTFSYDADDYLETITDPVLGVITAGYDSQGRISSLTDRQLPGEVAHTYTYTHTSSSYPSENNRVSQVTDPPGAGPGLTQDFVVSFTDMQDLSRLRYTGRRGEDWVYDYSRSDGKPKSFKNPLLEVWTFEYDGDRNMTKYTDPLSNDWTYTYDNRGNLESATDPLLHTQTWTYNTQNSVTSFTDPLGNQTDVLYEDPYCTTLATKFKEPDDQGQPMIATTIAYHAPGTDGQGMLSSVTDPEGILTTFEYDACGQVYEYGEGDDPNGTGMVLLFTSRADARSRVRQSFSSGTGRAGAGGGMSYNGVNQTTGGYCIWRRSGEGSSPRVPSTFPVLPDNAPAYATPYAEVWGITYDGLGQRIGQTATLSCEDCGQSGKSRVSSADFNELGLQESATVQTSESAGPQGLRSFAYTPNPGTGESTRVGPDGVETYVQRDVAGRVSYVRRGAGGAPMMEADYTYYDDGRVWRIVYGNGPGGNGASVTYQYDNARRLTRIDHWDPGNSILSLDYTYTDRDEIATIAEVDAMSGQTITTFTYDARGRLTHEVRDQLSPPGPPVYDLSYEYDKAGNRLKKVDAVADRVWCYTYDKLDPKNPDVWETNNNRLMFYVEYEGATTDCENPGAAVTVATTWYYYNDSGNVTRIVTGPSVPQLMDPMTATRFDYAANDRAVSYIVGEEWVYVSETSIGGYEITYAREFRYDGARQRYLVRELDPVEMMRDPIQYAVISDTWSDYDGDDIYGDFTISGGVASPVRSFEPGMGKFDWMDDGFGTQVPDDTPVGYYHTNQIGTTRVMTDSVGAPGSAAAYTAFGERISGTNYRYGYAGAWGYQAHTIDEVPPPHDPDTIFPYLHVGHRYYDPATGRFLQRDPIGIRGGLNVYAYTYNNPTVYIDPSGLGAWSWIKDKAKKAWEVAKKLPSYILPSSPVPADAAPDIATCFVRDAKRRHILKDHEDALPDPKCPTCKRLTPKPR